MTIILKQKSVIISFSIIILLLAQPVSAAIVNCGLSGTTTPCTLPHLVELVARLINTLIGLSWLVAVFFVFWSGYNMATAYGNQEKLTTAKSSFKDAIIGFFLIMVAFLLVNFVAVVLGGYSLNYNDQNSIFKLLPYLR